jgi:multisubunit Na+/H+ antiporter MnhG subunit
MTRMESETHENRHKADYPEGVPIMITCPTTSLARHVRVRRLVCATLFSAALALVVSPFAQPAIARADYDHNFYDFCRNSLQQGVDYCCAHAGGVVNDGKCV